MLKNSLYVLIFRMLSFAGAIIFSIISSRTLGPTGKGLLTVIYLVPMFVNRFATLGLGQSIVFFGKRHTYSLNQIFNFVMTIFFIIFGFLLFLTFIFQHQIMLLFNVEDLTNFQFWAPIIFVLPAVLLFYFFHIFLVTEQIFLYNIISIITIWVQIVGIAILYYVKLINITGIIVISSLANLTTFAVACYFLRSFFPKFSFSLNVKMLKDFFGYGLRSYSVTILSFLDQRIVLFVCAALLNKDEIAFYFLATHMGEMFWQIPDSIGIILFPKISGQNSLKDSTKITNASIRNSLFIILIGAIIAFLVVDKLILIMYGAQFMQVAHVFKVLLVGYLLMVTSRLLFTFFGGIGKPELTVYITLAVALTTGVSGYILTKYFGLMGAAFTTNITFFVASLLSCLFYYKETKSPLKSIFFVNKEDFLRYKRLLNSIFNKRGT